MTGKSFLPLLRGLRTDWRTAFLYEYNYEPQFPYTPNVRGVRTDRWKLIRYPQGDGSPDRFTAELYDLAHDPHELRNLIDDPGSCRDTAGTRATLRRGLARSRPRPHARVRRHRRRAAGALSLRLRLRLPPAAYRLPPTPTAYAYAYA